MVGLASAKRRKVNELLAEPRTPPGRLRASGASRGTVFFLQ
jgi:hypothetical protein